MTDYSQATSAPYNADNLKPHDENLVFVKEFGTEINPSPGEAFTTDAAATDPDTDNSVNARMGMLEVQSVDAESEAPRGTTFEVPPASDYPTSPILQQPNLRIYVMYAHLLLREHVISEPGLTQGMFVMAGDGFVGNVPNAPFGAVTIEPAAGGGGGDPDIGEEATAKVQQWSNGGDSGPTEEQDYFRWGTNLYLRFLIASDITKEQTQVVPFASRDGLTWTNLDASAGFDAQLTRVGLGMQSLGTVWLDWVRTYSWIIEAVPDGVFGLPYPPLTGDRRFS